MKAFACLRLCLLVLLGASACSVAGINPAPGIPEGQSQDAIPGGDQDNANPENQGEAPAEDDGAGDDAGPQPEEENPVGPIVEEGETELPNPIDPIDPVAPEDPVDPVVPEDPVDPEPLPEPLKLSIGSLPTEIRGGHKALQLSASLSAPSESRVVWKVQGEVGIDKGTIDGNGVYKAPEIANAESNIRIIASLEDDPEVKDERIFKLIPNQQTFVACTGNALFPVRSEIYAIPPETQDVPDFSRIGSSRLATLCKDDLEIPGRGYIDGVPGRNLTSFFAIRSEVQIVIPKDGDYTFRVISDDGSRLFLDGAPLILHGGQHEATAKDGSKNLKAGRHPLVLEYYQGPGNMTLSLQWQVPGSTGFRTITQESFETR